MVEGRKMSLWFRFHGEGFWVFRVLQGSFREHLEAKPKHVQVLHRVTNNLPAQHALGATDSVSDVTGARVKVTDAVGTALHGRSL